MRIFKKTVIFTLVLAICMSLFSFNAFAAGGTVAYGAGDVKASTLNIRSGPGTSYSRVGIISDGTTVVITEKTSSSWYKINYEGTVGYVSADYIVNVRTAADFSATGTLNGTNVNVRSGPGTSYSTVGTHTTGDKVTVIGINNGWYKINDGKVTGYIRSDYINITGAASATTTKSTSTTPSGSSSSTTGVLTGTGVNVRSGPGTNYKVVGSRTKGDTVTILGTENGWYKVSYGSVTGYIRSDYVSVSGSSTTNAPTTGSSSVGKQAANDALKYVGYRYVYGGATPSSGFDCSGLVYYVYGQLGYKLSRTASQQYANNGVKVSKSELQQGDLVFFSTNGSTVTHVGIYIGNGQFVHASTSKTGVIISDLNSTYYTTYWFGAKRIV